MFFPGSRYETTGTYSITQSNGETVRVAKLPRTQASVLLGYHRRLQGQRLDLIANRYLKDPTAFWRLCDANDAMIPDALAARDAIGIPPKS